MTLTVPTVVDRLIQQALHQVMQPVFEPTFSEGSFGFRPGKSAQQAVVKATGYIRAGKRWVVDMDLEKFFDRVNHDVLMARVARRVQDRRVLRLIRRFLGAGMMAGGVETARTQGTPQGGPLSPLLSNILLTDLDRELQARKLSFCRYADDCNIYVGSQQAGQRVMDGLRCFLAKRLKLTVNEAKSAVARPWERKFLGYSVTAQQASKIRIAKSSIERLKGRIRELCRQGRGRSLPRIIESMNPVLRGWMNYFSLTQSRMALTLAPSRGRTFELGDARRHAAPSTRGTVLVVVFAFVVRCDPADGRLCAYSVDRDRVFRHRDRRFRDRDRAWC